MFIIDAIKALSGPLCTVEVTSIEHQKPGSAQFPITDSVFKAQIKITALKSCTIVSHDFWVRAEVIKKKDYMDYIFADESHDKDSDIAGMNYSWPYRLKAGESCEDGCCILDVDIVKSLKSIGFKNANDVLDAKNLTFWIDVNVKVKGMRERVEASAKFRVVKGS